MANKRTEYSVQELENLNLDTSVNPPIIRRGLVGKAGDGSYYNISGDTEGNLSVSPNGSIIDTNNSTTTPLVADATFTGTATEILHFASIAILAHSDVASATSGLVIQFSPDGTDWHSGEEYTIPADTSKFFTPPTQARYMRVLYTNGGTDQTTFHLHTLLKKSPIKWSSHNINANLNDDDDSELVSAVLKLRTAQNTYVSGASTSSGNFKVSLEELESGVSDDSNSALKTSNYISDEYGNVARLLGDNIARGALLTIPFDHHEIHCGDSYTAHHVEDLGNGATIEYLIITPDWGSVGGTNPGDSQSVKLAHLVGELSGESETSFWFYEGAEASDNGTALSVVNRNRNSNKTDVLSIYQGATITSTGTELEHGKFGSGKLTGGSADRTDEWVLKNNTIYLLRITNDTTSNNYHTVRFQYYVHPGV